MVRVYAEDHGTLTYTAQAELLVDMCAGVHCSGIRACTVPSNTEKYGIAYTETDIGRESPVGGRMSLSSMPTPQQLVVGCR